VHLAIDAGKLTIRSEDRGRVVIEAGGATLKERRYDDNLKLSRQPAKRFGGRSRD
jgi:hypothetical protein